MRLLAVYPLLVLGAAPAAAEKDLRPFTAEDIFELEWADDPQISPDGTRAVYVRRSNDAMKDRTVSRVWLASLDGTSHEPLLADEGSYSSPHWSPGGDRIAYMKRTEGRAGLYVHWLGSSRSALLATFEEAPANLVWSSDSRSLALTKA